MPRILVVENRHVLQFVIAGILQTVGYDVVEVCDSVEGLYWLARDPSFDGILSDVQLPGGDGFQFLEALTKRYPAIPVVMISEDNRPVHIERLVRTGAWCVLCVPFKKEQLIEAVQEMTL